MRAIVRSCVGGLSSVNNWMRSTVSGSRKTRLEAIVELLVAIPVFITCLYYYGKWNEVPVHTDEIEVACLKFHQPEADTLSEWSPVAKITYEINTSKVRNSKLRAGDILLDFTDNWKPFLRYNPLNHNVSREEFIRDSIARQSDYWNLAKLKNNIVAAKVNGTPFENEKSELLGFFVNRPNQYDEDLIESQLEESATYQRELLDFLKLSVNDSITWWSNNPTTGFYALYYFRINCKWNISEHEDYDAEPYYGLPKQSNSGARKISFFGYKDSTYYLNYFLLKLDEENAGFSDSVIVATVESPLVNPKWFSKFDISQSYFDIKLRCESVDSVVLKFDFVGATDFSEMIPKPDTIAMSSIIFSDPHKITQIKEKGLSFHAHFKEKDGTQTIRLFAITALMCVFTPILLMCLVNIIILLIAGIRKISHYKKRKVVS